MNHSDYANRADLQTEFRADLNALEVRMDAKFDYFAMKIVEDISEVLAEMMAQIDARFNQLEIVGFGRAGR